MKNPLKEWWPVLVLAIGLIGSGVTTHNATEAHSAQIAQLEKEERVDDIAQQRLTDKVDVIDEKVDKLESKQDDMLREQAAQSKVQFQQSAVMEQILKSQSELLREIRKTNAGP